MLISVRNRFVFIANTKTASTSIERLLTPMSDIVLARAPLKHLKVVELEKIKCVLPPEGVKGYFKFGVFRDPVDWAISWFNYRSRPEIKGHPNYLGDTSFEMFVRHLGQRHRVLQRRMFVNRKNRNAMSFLIRYEFLEQDLRYVLEEKLGFKGAGIIEKLGKQNVSRVARVKRDMLEQSTIEELKRIFASDYAFKARFVKGPPN